MFMSVALISKLLAAIGGGTMPGLILAALGRVKSLRGWLSKSFSKPSISTSSLLPPRGGSFFRFSKSMTRSRATECDRCLLKVSLE